MIKNAVEKAENVSVNPHYDLCVCNLMEIYEACGGGKDTYALIHLSFNFGYLQGMKAAKAEAGAAGRKKPATTR